MIPAEIVAFCVFVGLLYLWFRAKARGDELASENKALRSERDELQRRLADLAESIIDRDTVKQEAPRAAQSKKPSAQA